MAALGRELRQLQDTVQDAAVHGPSVFGSDAWQRASWALATVQQQLTSLCQRQQQQQDELDTIDSINGCFAVLQGTCRARASGSACQQQQHCGGPAITQGPCQRTGSSARLLAAPQAC